LEDTLPYLFALLSIEEQPSPLAQMDPQIRRRRTFEALKKLFLRESLNQPLVLIFEDLHWIDGETQGFLDVLCESLASAKLLLLTNYRPEYKHEWGQKTYYTQLRLAPFGKEEAEEFLDVLLGQSPLPAGERVRVRGVENDFQTLKQLILDKTQGTPFFMEEIVQELREQGLLTDLRRVGAAHQYLDLHLPTTVQAVLAARIDRLTPDEKALLQQLAVIGRQFPLRLIRHVITQPEADLYRLLMSLQHKEFLYEQPAFPESEYIFKHALTQDVAYGTVLQEQRKTLHEQTGHAIEQLYHERLDEHYDELAHHYHRSGNTEKAIHYLHLAGQQAVQRSAHPEAIRHLTAALNLLLAQPETLERADRELMLQIALGVSLMATKGFAAPEVERIYTRARELCQQIGEISQLFSALWGLFVCYFAREDLGKTYDLGKQLLTLAQRAQDSALLLGAHMALGYTYYCLGEFVSSREHLEQGIALYDPQQRHALALLYSGVDPTVMCLSLGAWPLWTLGHSDQAFQRSRDAVTLAQELSHLPGVAYALCFAVDLHSLRREVWAAQDQAETAITLSADQGFPFWLARGTIVRGWALAKQGQGQEGIALIHQGMAAYQATGAEVWRSYFLALLAEVYGAVGQIEEGLATVVDAFDWTYSTGGLYFEAELYRLKGELTLQSKASLGQVEDKFQTSQSPSEVEKEAEACFLKAIEIAQRQQAKSLELRAATSLARLWQSQGRTIEARELLAPVYNWFTEGFDTKDLQEAKVLLEELEGSEEKTNEVAE
jgi:predicted ATPase